MRAIITPTSKVLNSTEKCVIVKASAGAGKTTLITSKVQKIIEENPDATIRVLTFNRDAAADDKKRIDAKISEIEYYKLGRFKIRFNIPAIAKMLLDQFYELSPNYNVSTIHSFAIEVVNKYGAKYNKPFLTRIAQKYDDNEIKKLDIIGINGVDEKKDSINKWKLIHHTEYIRILIDNPDSIKSYLSKQSGNNKVIAEFVIETLLNKGITFDDCIFFANYILKKHKNLAKDITSDYLIIDEFQDVDPYQFDIILSIEEYTKQVIVVGDPSQNIYAFRNSMTNCFDAIKEHFDVLYNSYLEVNMSRSYRCPIQICKCANNLMRNYPDYEPMNSTVNSIIPEYHFFESEVEEFKYVYDQITKLLDMGVHLHSIIVMTYTNKTKEKFEKYTNNKIKTETIHAQKGRGYDYVFIIGVHSYSFPSNSGIMTACHMADKLQYLYKSDDENTILLAKQILETTDELTNTQLYDLLIDKIKSSIDTSRFRSNRDAILAFLIDRAIKEQYRLMYVAITRTKINLTITGHKSSVMSPLISDIGEAIKVVNHTKNNVINPINTGFYHIKSNNNNLGYIAPSEILALSPDTIVISVKTSINIAAVDTHWSVSMNGKDNKLIVQATTNCNGIDFCYYPMYGVVEATFSACNLLYGTNTVDFSKNDTDKLLDIVMNAVHKVTGNHLINAADIKLKRVDLAVMQRFDDDHAAEQQMQKIKKHCNDNNVACIDYKKDNTSLYLSEKRGNYNNVKEICDKDIYTNIYRKDIQQNGKLNAPRLDKPTIRLENRLKGNALVLDGNKLTLEDLFKTDGLMEYLYVKGLNKIKLDLSYADLKTYREIKKHLKSNITVRSRDKELKMIDAFFTNSKPQPSDKFIERIKDSINELGYHLRKIPRFRNYNDAKVSD